MAVQIRGRQILNATITSDKLVTSNTFDFSSGVLRAASPSGASDVATRSFVESLVNGLAWKDACRVATTASITIASDLNVGDTIDGITLADGDRVLVKNQTGDNANQNGIYVAGASPARAADMDAGSEFSSAAVFIQEGSLNADVGFVCTNDGTVTVGSTNIVFTQFTGAAQISAGNGLAKSGNTLSVNVDDSSLEINSDALRVKAAGITNAMLAGSIADSKLAQITSSDKVAGSAVQLAGSGGLSNDSGLKISAGGVTNAMLAGSIANAKLANSTISGVALGANLNSLSLASNSGLTMSSYNGSAAVGDLKMNLTQLSAGTAQMIDEIAIDRAGSTVRESLQDIFGLAAGTASATSLAASSGVLSVKVDDLSIARDGSGNLVVKANGIGSGEIAANAVGSSEIAANAVGSSEIADDAVTMAKLGYQGYFETATASGGSYSTMDLGRAIDTAFVPSFSVSVNGLLMAYASSPSGQDQYSIANNGAGSVGRITFGAALTDGDVVAIRYVA